MILMTDRKDFGTIKSEKFPNEKNDIGIGLRDGFLWMAQGDDIIVISPDQLGKIIGVIEGALDV